MPKERNKADGYREKVPIKREKIDACIDSSEREVSRPKVKAYEGNTKAMNRMLAPMAYAASPINWDAQRYELAANGGDAQAQFATGWFLRPFGSKRAELERLMTGTGVPVDEKKGLKWIHKATFQGYQPAIDYCKEHGYKWY